MTRSIKIGDFNYSAEVLEAEATSARYAELRAEALRDDKNWYAVWKCAERQMAFANIAQQQREQIHTGVSGLTGNSDCNCGLLAPTQPGDLEWRSAWMFARGHLNHPDKSVVDCFLVTLRSDITLDWSIFYYCQTCDDLEPSKVAQGQDAQPFKAFQQLHSHDKGQK